MIERRRVLAMLAGVVSTVIAGAASAATKKPTPAPKKKKVVKKKVVKKPPAKATATPTSSPTANQPSTTQIIALSAVPIGTSKLVDTRRNGSPISVIVTNTAKGPVVFDALCTHAGCLVRPNDNGKDLICPCHLSRFNSESGAVIASPALLPLGRLPSRVENGFVVFD
jgi:Rieske Fe-S protein